ncbi:MAG: TadE/TadG family type IV pilus assembly protein [Bdellovibrionota bacterium]
MNNFCCCISKRTHRATANERGASMLEFSIAAPVLMVAILGFFDIIQWLSVKQALDEAAVRAADYAATVPNLDIDPTGLDPASYEFKRLMLARQKSNNAGYEFLHNSGLISVPNRSTGTAGVTYDAVYTEDRDAGDPVDVASPIMVLLPGDCATVSGTGETICNRDGMGAPGGAGRPQSSPARLLERHSIMAIGTAQTRGFLPYFGSKVIRTVQYAPRQSIPQAPFAAPEDPLLITGAQPTPYATPPAELGAPVMPTPPAVSCVVNALRCTQSAVQSSYPFCPRPDDGGTGTGICECSNSPTLCAL